MTSMQKWLRIGATLMFGLFVAYLDRSNLSVTLPTITHDLNIDGATASIVLTIFLIGYAFSNILPKAFIGRSSPASPATGFQTKNGRRRTALSSIMDSSWH